jgi:hypothetical protein
MADTLIIKPTQSEEWVRRYTSQASTVSGAMNELPIMTTAPLPAVSQKLRRACPSGDSVVVSFIIAYIGAPYKDLQAARETC